MLLNVNGLRFLLACSTWDRLDRLHESHFYIVEKPSKERNDFVDFRGKFGDGALAGKPGLYMPRTALCLWACQRLSIFCIFVLT